MIGDNLAKINKNNITIFMKCSNILINVIFLLK